ncbi:MAG TPA: ComEC/Rec2 family competence protein, partial [Candidatus Rubrimentiphilum sp.]|nr:ComEC/Rec2 family competence protein [Candidatus Rubrimentiphilum sp.]
IGTWPLIASLFLLFAPYAALANLAVVPCVGATMILGAIQLLAAPVPQLAAVVASVNTWLLAWIVGIVHTIAGLPGASVPTMPSPAWTIAFYDALLIVAMMLWKRSARTLAIALFLFGALAVTMPPRPIDHRLQVTVLDVGQADAVFIRTPRGHALLVDAGGRLEQGQGTQSSAERVGERVVVPFLRRQGVRTIDAMILSHPHGDHVGGFAPVLRAFRAEEFADSGQRYGGYAYNDALQTAKSEHVAIVYPRAGAMWQTDDGVTIEFIGPSLPFIAGSHNDINNNSVAFMLVYKHFRMLFTGDAGAEAEQRFLNEGIDLHADVLKIGHHGSAYSSTPAFIAAVHPKYAIISVGRHNMFGHPAPSTIETLQRYGADVYRTDENGAISLATNGRATTLSPMLP